MKLSSLALAAALVGLGALAPALHAVPITYNFVTTSAPVGTTFTASTSIDSSVSGVFSGVGTLLSFTATISGNGTATVNRTWGLSEVSFAQGTLNSGVLLFSGLQATDTALVSGSSLNNFLNGGATGFSAPLQIIGSWQRAAAANPVPDQVSAWAAPLVLLALLAVGQRARRKLSAQA
jgi:hypothetical protein